MKKLISVLLFACLSLHAAYVTIDATFTNRSLISSNFVINGVTVTYTNAPLNNSTWIVTNNAAQSATNLQRFIGANYRSLYARMTNATNVTISGNDLQFSFPGNSAAHFAFTTTNSLTVTNGWLVSLPWGNQTATNRTNTASEMISGLGIYSTNALPMDATALSNHVSRTNSQLVTHKLLNLSILSNSIVVDSVFNQGAFSNRIINAGTIVGGAYTNGTHTNSVWGSGSFMGRITSTAIITGGGLSNTIADTLTATNFSAPGSGLNSQQIGSGSDASGAETISFGVGSAALANQSTALGYGAVVGLTADFSVALGWNAVADETFTSQTVLGPSAFSGATEGTAVGFNAEVAAGHTDSTAIGANALTTAANQIRMGTSAETVSVPGKLEAAIAFISNLVGSNYISGALYSLAGSYVSLVSGASTTNIIQLATNTVTMVSGNSADAYIISMKDIIGTPNTPRLAITINNTAYNHIFVDESASETVAGRRLKLGGANFTLSPYKGALWCYSTADSRWELIASSSSAVTATNVSAASASIATNTASFSYVTNPIASGMYWTNTTLARVALKVTWTLNDSAIAGFPSLCMTNVSSGEFYNPTNSFVLAGVTSGRAEFHLSPGDYFIATNKSSGSASATVDASFAVKE